MNRISRKVVLLLSAISLLLLWFHYNRESIQSPTLFDAASVYSKHPIVQLVEAGQTRLEVLLSKQSSNLQDARKEYIRRYHRHPPLGFDAWFKLAQKHNFLLIDEFDILMHDLEPFQGMSIEVMKDRIRATIETKGSRVGVINITDQHATISEGDEGLTALWASLIPNPEWLKLIPYNMTLLVNTGDEPMVSATFEEVTESIKLAGKTNVSAPETSLSVLSAPLRFAEVRKQNSWPFTSKACSADTPSRQPSCPPKSSNSPFSFIADPSIASDVCQNCDLLSTHGLLLNPEKLDVAQNLVPIWSASRPSHFNDILYPSPYYTSTYFPELMITYDPEEDRAWAEKESKFYWTGTTTGGWATEETWNRMQRQRLVLKTHNLSEPIQLLDETSAGTAQWQPRSSTMHEISDLFATRMTKASHCSEEMCQMQKEVFGIPEPRLYDAQSWAYQFKFLFDIDGNGFSGRFYRLLKSRSVVVKQTILSEWHDDRLIPWVHYVPLSTSYDELPELARFLATTEEGLRISERIAIESTEWRDKALRDIDLQLVWLRSLLEFGRIMNGDMHE